MKRTKNSLEYKLHGNKVVYELIDIIAFSPRKRMSVIVKNLETMKVECYTKGADSAIFEKSEPYANQNTLK